MLYEAKLESLGSNTSTALSLVSDPSFHGFSAVPDLLYAPSSTQNHPLLRFFPPLLHCTPDPQVICSQTWRLVNFPVPYQIPKISHCDW